MTAANVMFCMLQSAGRLGRYSDSEMVVVLVIVVSFRFWVGSKCFSMKSNTLKVSMFPLRLVGTASSATVRLRLITQRREMARARLLKTGQRFSYLVPRRSMLRCLEHKPGSPAVSLLSIVW